MNWQDYINEVRRTARGDLSHEELIINAVLGLCGESGEIADHIKKWRMQGHALRIDAIQGELGDILWYWTLLCDEMGLSPLTVMEANITKLRTRYATGFSTEASVARVDTVTHHADGNEGGNDGQGEAS